MQSMAPLHLCYCLIWHYPIVVILGYCGKAQVINVVNALVLHSQSHLHSAKSMLERGLAAPFIILL